MTVDSGRQYDEEALGRRLDSLSAASRAVFAAACAEMLMPLYQRISEITGEGSAGLMRAAIDFVWSTSVVDPSALARAQALAFRNEVEASVPDSDDEGAVYPWTAFAQNAAASAAYALRCWQTGDAQDAVWAARQLREVADLIVQGVGKTYVPEIDNRRPVQVAVGWMGAALDALARDDPAGFRAAAERDGLLLLAEAVAAPAAIDDLWPIAARYLLGRATWREVESWGLGAIARGVDLSTVTALASISARSEDVWQLLGEELNRRGLEVPTPIDASRVVVRDIALAVMNGELPPYEGATALWRVARETPELEPGLREFIGLASEYEDQPGYRDEYEADLLAAFRRLS